MTDHVSLPNNPGDRQKLKQMLAEMTYCLQRADAEKEAMKEIAEVVYDTFDIPKKIVNKLAKTMYKRNYADLQAENEDFEYLYEALVEGKNESEGDA